MDKNDALVPFGLEGNAVIHEHHLRNRGEVGKEIAGIGSRVHSRIRMPPSCGRKKRTGFGPHPGRRKTKPDTAGMQVAHGDFSPESRGMRAAFRRAIEKDERFWSAPWKTKTQARCGWDAVRARRFLAGVAGDASGIQTGD